MAKTALCIGINNYPGTDMDLSGCVNDAADWAAELQARGFGVTRLTDGQATKAAMVDAFGKLIGGAAAGDLVVITYSGHGTYMPDTDGDEPDGLDEGLCPHDIASAGPLLDDEIHRLFGARKPGVRILLISDSCHSGTVTRAVATEADAALPRARFLPMANWARGAAAARIPAQQPKQKGRSAFRKVVKGDGDLLLSGCQEGPNNFSWDTQFRGRPNGAFTYHALKALRELKADATYADWHAAVTPTRLPTTDCPQEPQIVGSAAMRNARVFA